MIEKFTKTWYNIVEWNVGEYLADESKKVSWGDSFIDETAKYIQQNCPEIKGFNRRSLYRMKQFYETYKDDEIVSTVLTQLSWSNHLEILSTAKTQEECKKCKAW